MDFSKWFLVAVAVVTMASTASAQERAADVSFMFGSTVDSNGAEDSPQPAGVGFGARAGVILEDLNLYSGLLGTFVPGSTGQYGGFDVDARHVQLGGEFGYELTLGRRLALRPALGAGASMVSIIGGQDAELSTAGFVAPSLSFSVQVGDLRFGVDGRYAAVLSDDQANSVSVFGTVGMRIRTGKGRFAGGPARASKKVAKGKGKGSWF